MRIETAAEEKPVSERAHRSHDDLDRRLWLDPALISLPFQKMNEAFAHRLFDGAHRVSDQRIPARFGADLDVKADLFDGFVTAILLCHASERGKEHFRG